MMVSYKNYVQVPGWAITELHLNSLNEILIYSIIFGFCQNNNSTEISISYFSEWTYLTKPTIILHLKDLEKRNLIKVTRSRGEKSTYSIVAWKAAELVKKAIEDEAKSNQQKQEELLKPSKYFVGSNVVSLKSIIKNTVDDTQAKYEKKQILTPEGDKTREMLMNNDWTYHASDDDKRKAK